MVRAEVSLVCSLQSSFIAWAEAVKFGSRTLLTVQHQFDLLVPSASPFFPCPHITHPSFGLCGLKPGYQLPDRLSLSRPPVILVRIHTQVAILTHKTKADHLLPPASARPGVVSRGARPALTFPGAEPRDQARPPSSVPTIVIIKLVLRKFSLLPYADIIPRSSDSPRSRTPRRSDGVCDSGSCGYSSFQ